MSDETVDLSRLDDEVTTFIKYGYAGYVPGRDCDQTMPIQVGDETVPLPRFTVEQQTPYRPTDRMILMFVLVGLVMVATLVASLIMVIH
jgi:hypothetical protein